MASQRNRGRFYSTMQPELPSPGELMKLAGRPADLIAHPAWSEARETVIALTNAGPALIALLGAPGTGKTALLRDLATRFGELGRVVSLLEFGDSPQDVGAPDIVLVDEADRISASRLDELRSLKGVSVVLAALPASRDRFASYPDARAVDLTLLSPDEACKFLWARLEQLGLPKTSLTEAAWARLVAHGHGVPRLLNALLGHALFVASGDQAARVTASHVDEAIAARGGDLGASTAEPARAGGDQVARVTVSHVDETVVDETVAARGGEPEASPAEPARAEPPILRDLVPADVPVISVGADVTASEPERDLVATMPLPRPPPGRFRSSLVVGSYVAAIVAVYAIPVAALLTWGLPWHTGKTVRSGLEVPGIVRTEVPALVRTIVTAAKVGMTEVAAIMPRAVTSTPVTAGAGSAGQVAAASPSRMPPSTAQPVEPGAVASAPVTAGAGPAGQVAAASPSRMPPSAAQPVDATAVPPPGPVSVPEAPPVRDESMVSKDAEGTEPPRTVVQTAQPAGSDAKIARKTRHAAAASAKLDRVLSQIDQWSREPAPESWRKATVRERTVQRGPRNVAPMTAQEGFIPEPSSEGHYLRQPETPSEPRSPVLELLSARRALAANNSSVARALLEAAQTSIVFDAGTAPDRASIAATQISNALGMLNSGDAASARPYVERAITAFGRPTS